MAKHVIQQHYEMTELIIPATPPPPEHIKQPPPPKLPPPPETPKVELQPSQIEMPKPKPEPKPVQMEAKVNMPAMQAKPQIILAPQPHAALDRRHAGAGQQSQALHRARASGRNLRRHAESQCDASGHRVCHRQSLWRHERSGGRAPWRGRIDGHRERHQVRLQLRHVRAKLLRPAFRAPAAREHGIELRQGGLGRNSRQHAGLQPLPRQAVEPVATNLEVLSKPPVQYTAEARQLKVEGDVVLRVTFLASGQVVVQGVVRGLGHGLDEEARRVAQQIRFRPATRDGRAVDITTTITITFQLA